MGEPSVNAGERNEIAMFTSHHDEVPDLLRQIATYLEAEPDRVLIGMWDICAGESWEATIQVVTTVMSEESPDD